LSFTPSTKKNVRNIAGISAVGLAAVLLLSPAVSTANFSASDIGTIDVKAATLSVGLTDDKATVGSFDLDFTNLKPGEVQHQTFYVTNTGSIPATVKVGVDPKPSPSAGAVVTSARLDVNKLAMGVSGITALTPYRSLPASVNLGSIASGETKAYVLDVSLDSSAGNEWQGVGLSTTATVTLDQQ